METKSGKGVGTEKQELGTDRGLESGGKELETGGGRNQEGSIVAAIQEFL